MKEDNKIIGTYLYNFHQIEHDQKHKMHIGKYQDISLQQLTIVKLKDNLLMKREISEYVSMIK